MFDSSNFGSLLRGLSFVLLGSFVTSLVPPVAAQADHSPRQIVANLATSTGAVDRFFDLSVGSDYPGTLIRDDSQAQLKLAVDELGFRYIRFHAIFHDVLGTVRTEDGKTVYDWAKIDQLYDDMLSRHIRPAISSRSLNSALLPRRLPLRRTASFIGRATPRTLIRMAGAT